ncbi:hypothetical protein PIB30_080167 [Stylosanthes scabra]|uniref:Uncharacterized protein n=1 Tax=Stylosanthes scabra TaxID=79078 RepID=A0ABU6UT40_9FABA|nr:hypothetical protein [Stylosanthes scabra]
MRTLRQGLIDQDAMMIKMTKTPSSCHNILAKVFPALGLPRVSHKIGSLTPIEKIQAHRYVLTNCTLVDKFREKCICDIARKYRGRKNATKLVEEYMHAKFHEWFRAYVRELEADEPFILATDARMVYYVDDPSDIGWCSDCHMKPRDLYDMGDLNEEDLDESLVEDIPFCEQQVENLEEFPLVRGVDNELEADEIIAEDENDNDCEVNDGIDTMNNFI